eukprot:SAG31_NODE_44841_length_261_cov_0.635802_1_plen_68_part_10
MQLFVGWSDEKYRQERLLDSDEAWYREVGAYYKGDCIYRDDLLPVPSYLARIISAYANLPADPDASYA